VSPVFRSLGMLTSIQICRFWSSIMIVFIRGISTANRRVLVRSDISSLGRAQKPDEAIGQYTPQFTQNFEIRAPSSSITSKVRYVLGHINRLGCLLLLCGNRFPLRNCSHTFGANGAISLAFENCFLLERNRNVHYQRIPSWAWIQRLPTCRT
jgi:hypothetical protein